MSKREWTPTQLDAINTRDRTLLVSAAAGSGKTAVLTERIIASLLDTEHPSDISRMLIVTFTKAAASELSSRITDALREALATRPENSFLEEQLLLLPTAQIRTIDSFCADFLRRYATEAGISPRFRVADEAESQLLATSVMSDLLSDCYEGVGFSCAKGSFAYNQEDFLLLADSLTTVQSSEIALTELLLSLYRTCEGTLNGAMTLTAKARDFAVDAKHALADAACFYVIADAIIEAFSYYITQYDAGLAVFDEKADGDLRLTHGKTFHFERERLETAVAALRDHRADVAKEALEEILFVQRLPAYSGPELWVDKTLCAVRLDAREYIKERALPFLSFGEENWQMEAPRLSRALSQLAGLLSSFEERFNKEKKERGICEYNDLERLTLNLLTAPDGDGEPSTLALSVQGYYDAVYIDEYQDVNEVQNMIFSLLSNGKNAFMVGDVKQSIYRFRGAEPSIFSALRHIPAFKKGVKAERSSIFMQSNFRCDPPIIDFSNAVFDVVFGLAGGIGYRPEDRLVAGKRLPEDATPKRVRVLLTAPAKSGGKSQKEKRQAMLTKGEAEAACIAREIRHLLADGRRNDGEKIELCDIAILLRSVRTTFAKHLQKALSAANLPTEVHEDTDFFLNPEVLLMLSLLNVIDNPRRDIYLAGVLRSPLFGFSMDELLSIRREGSADVSLYECLLIYAKAHPNDEKCKLFLTTLERYRDRAEGMSISQLLRFLYDDTAIMSLVGSMGEKSDNLHMLYHYAASYEGNALHGLYSFLRYIDRIVRENRRMPSKREADMKSNAIRIMTVHASKGLEFPVCFFSHTDQRFRSDDNLLQYDGGLGAALCLRTADGYGVVENPLFMAARLTNAHAEREEAFRVLYVALTRAKERLYITGHVTNLSSLARPFPRIPLSHYEVMSEPNYLSLMLHALHIRFDPTVTGTPHNTCLAETRCAEVVRVLAWKPNAAISDAYIEDDVDTNDTQEFDCKAWADTLRKRFDFVYPHEGLHALPGKLSVSRLVSDVLDAENEADVLDIVHPFDIGDEEDIPAERETPTRPKFLAKEEDKDAATRGTATHLFLQFCDFVNLDCQRDEDVPQALQAEIERLVKRRFLTESDAACIRKKELEAFCRSPLFRALRGAKKVYRELRFHAKLPAVAFTLDEQKKKQLKNESIFVQGVVDAVLVGEDGSYDLIDYKTDRLPKNREEAKALLLKRYTAQLGYYQAACRRMFSKEPRSVLIYALALGDTVSVPIPEPFASL